MLCDWGATHATDFINAGLDMEMSGPLPVPFIGPMYFVNGPKREANDDRRPEKLPLSAADLPEEPAQKSSEPAHEQWPTTDLMKLVAAGAISEDTITRAAGRVLFEMDRFGFLDGKNKLEVTPSDNTEDVKIIEKTAIDAAVLLKNQDGTLPLKAADLDSLALIGPGAAQTIAVGLTGEKAVGLPALEMGPLAALRQLTPILHSCGTPSRASDGYPAVRYQAQMEREADHRRSGIQRMATGPMTTAVEDVLIGARALGSR